MINDHFDLKSWVNDVNERLLKLEKSHIVDNLSTPSTSSFNTENQSSINDFLKMYIAKSLLDKALIFSYYLEKIQKLSRFSLKDIKQY